MENIERGFGISPEEYLKACETLEKARIDLKGDFVIEFNTETQRMDLLPKCK